jgi:uncharacterized protein YjiS (DUF1127 family)
MRQLIASPRRLCALVTRSGKDWLPQTLAAFRRRRLERATRLSLQTLDARTLHDLGMNRGEIPFLAARVGEGRMLAIAERGDDRLNL